MKPKSAIQNLQRDQKDFRRASSLMLRNEQKIGTRLDALKQGFSGIFLQNTYELFYAYTFEYQLGITKVLLPVSYYDQLKT